MLWMIAQPTRKHPEKLPRYQPTESKSTKPKRTAQSIVDELINKWADV